jgi:hypothetical protein
MTLIFFGVRADASQKTQWQFASTLTIRRKPPLQRRLPTVTGSAR